MLTLSEAIANLNESEVARLVSEKIDAGVEATYILDECRRGMDIVGQRYKEGEYFLSELIVSGEIFKNSMKILEPYLPSEGSKDKLAKIVIATVKGDIHNIGKDIAAMLLKATGFEVYDLGVDVAPNTIVDKLIETEAQILGMSGLLTPSFNSMKISVEAVAEAGMRDKVKIIIGGGIVNEMVAKHTGADAFTNEGIKGVDICKRLVQELK